MEGKPIKMKVVVNSSTGLVFLTKTFREFMSALQKKLSNLDTTKQYMFTTNVNNECEFHDEDTYNKFRNFCLNSQEDLKLKIKGAPMDDSFINFSKQITNLLKNEFQSLEKSIKDICTLKVLSEQKTIFEKEIKRTDNDVHNICCKECFQTNFSGNRYLCAECDNYNLCEKCERRKPHIPDHILIRITDAIEDDNEPYSSDFMENDPRRLVKYSKDSEKVFEVKIINDGRVPWEKVFILPIAYGEQYVWGKKVIVPNTEPNKQVSVKLTFDIQPNKKGRFTSKWRMFKQNGLPFGKVLEFEVEIE